MISSRFTVLFHRMIATLALLLCCAGWLVVPAFAQMPSPAPILPGLHLAASSQPEPGVATDAGPAPFHVQFDPTETTIGERVRVSILGDDPSADPGAIQSVRFDRSTTATADWDIAMDWARDMKGASSAAANGKSGVWRATVRPFAVGQLALPTVTIDYLNHAGARHEARLTSAALTVRSIRPAGSKGVDLIGLRGLAEPPPTLSTLAKIGIGAGILLAAGALIWAIAAYFMRRKVPVAEPPLPTGLWALRELERRSRLPVCQTGPAKTIYSMVSEVMRIYIARRYGVPAIDMTTREVMHALRNLGAAPATLDGIESFLNECDLVKFSRIEMPRERWATIWNDAKTLVQRTTPASELSAGAGARAEEAA